MEYQDPTVQQEVQSITSEQQDAISTSSLKAVTYAFALAISMLFSTGEAREQFEPLTQPITQNVTAGVAMLSDRLEAIKAKASALLEENHKNLPDSPKPEIAQQEHVAIKPPQEEV